MSSLPLLPLLIPFSTAAVLLLLWRAPGAQRVISVAGAAALLAAGVALFAAVLRGQILVVQVGGWPAPFGITLVADLFAAIMVVLAGALGSAVMVYSIAGAGARREAFGYHPLQHVMLLGVCGAFLTGDVFNLYVWFEVMLVASFALLSLGGERAQLEGSIKYVILNLLSSALFLAATGILYGLIGTLNMADAARQLRIAPAGPATAVALLLLAAFGIKAAVFPLYFWLPASYHTPPVPVAALFAGLLTKVAVYAMVRTFTLLFVQDPATTRPLILAIGGLTMVSGVLGAVAQDDTRRILAFHSVSQIGYMLMGLGLSSPLGLAGTIVFMVHHGLVKTDLFLVAGIMAGRRGSHDLGELSGLYRASPGVAALFLLPALSLAGVPPLSGFWAKLMLLRAGLSAGRIAIVTAALAVSFLTLYSMMKIWTRAFWDDRAPTDSGARDPGRAPLGADRRPTLVGPAVFLTALMLLLGALAGPALRVAMRAAEQLLRPADYERAVLGPPPGGEPVSSEAKEPLSPRR